MPRRLNFARSLNGGRRAYPLCARCRGKLDTGFFICLFGVVEQGARAPPVRRFGKGGKEDGDAVYQVIT